MITEAKVLDDNSTLEEWLILADYIAKKHYGGHFTLFAFSFSYKFAFGTITERDEINDLPGYSNLKDAIINAHQEFCVVERKQEREFIPFNKPTPNNQ
jgi:hypothetical protein